MRMDARRENLAIAANRAPADDIDLSNLALMQFAKRYAEIGCERIGNHTANELECRKHPQVNIDDWCVGCHAANALEGVVS